MWLTWANGLTVVRLLLALPCACLAANDRWTAAALLLSLAIVTDLLDGPLARRLHQSSPLGGLADHATDAVFIAVLLAALWTTSLVPWPLPLLVAMAFCQYVVDSRALAGRTLRASWLGRVNGIGYFVLASVIVYRNALGLGLPGDAAIEAFAWLLTLSTVASMLHRARGWLSARGAGAE